MLHLADGGLMSAGVSMFALTHFGIRKGQSWAKYGFLTLFVTIFLVSWVGFFQEGLDSIGTIDDPFFDYIFKPMFWFLLIGSIPSILVGLFCSNEF